MDYIARIEDIAAQDRFIGTQVSEWKNQLDKVQETTQALIKTSHMKGATADRTKEYFTGVYGSVQKSMGLLLATFSGNWGTYFKDYRDIDNNSAYVIPTAEVEEINRRQKSKRSGNGITKESLDAEVRSAIGSVSDLVSVYYKGIDPVYSEHDSLGNMLDRLVEAIDDTEQTHKGDFSEIDSILTDLHSLLLEMSGKDTVYKLNFDGASFASSATYQKLYSSYNKLATVYEKKASEYQKAQEARKGYYDQLQAEEEERRRQADFVKKLALGVCIIGGIAATVFTAGAASPILVATISGAATGALMAGVNTAADMYTVGGWDGIDWGGVGIEALKGGAVGAATGLVSGAASQGLGQVGKWAVDKVSSPLLKGGAKILVKGTEGALSKALAGGVQDISSAILDGESVDEAFRRAGGNVGKNLVSGFTKGVVSEGISMGMDKVTGNMLNDKSVTDDFGKIIGTKAVAGGFTEVVASGSARFMTELVTGEGTFEERLANGWNKASNIQDVALDFTTGAASSAAQEYVQQKPRRDAEMAARDEAQKHNAKQREARNALMKKNGVTGIKETGTGNLDFSESEFMYSQDGISGEVEIEIRNGNASGADKTAFEKAYREKLGDDSWKKPHGYSVHHGDITVHPDGRVTVKCQLVKTEANRDYKHAGGASQLETYVDEVKQHGGADIPTGKKGQHQQLSGYNDQLKESKEIEKQQSQIKNGVKASRFGKDAGPQLDKERQKEKADNGGYNLYQYVPTGLPY